MEQERVLKELDALVKEGKEKILPTKWRMEGVDESMVPLTSEY